MGRRGLYDPRVREDARRSLCKALRIYGTLSTRGVQECADIALTEDVVLRQLRRLETAGYVVQAGTAPPVPRVMRVRPTRGGRPALTWAITDAGRAWEATRVKDHGRLPVEAA